MAKRRLATLVICNHPGCRVLTESQYCPLHKPVPGKRLAGRDRFLDSKAWRKMSGAKLHECPWCELCHAKGVITPAVDVDHILPRKTHPGLALDWANLQSLCLVCHGRKTKAGL